MRYQLLRLANDATEPVLSGDLESDFAAIDWARAWLEANANHNRYRLQRPDGSKPMLMIKTLAGQWYAMALSDEPEIRPG